MIDIYPLAKASDESRAKLNISVVTAAVTREYGTTAAETITTIAALFRFEYTAAAPIVSM